MLKVGRLFIPEDPYFKEYFETNEVFEGENLTKALEVCESFRTAVDGGAHVGSWTRELAKLFKSVHAFEPNEDNFQCLIANTASLNNVRIHRDALGNRFQSRSLRNGTNSGSGYLDDGAGVLEVTLDSLYIEDLDFLKLDVEGYETFALEGAKETLKRCRPVVVVEQKQSTARYGLPWDSAGKYLESLGYVFFAQVNNDYIYRFPCR